MSKPYRLLVLTSQLPYPPQQGATIRSFNLLRELAGRAEIDLLSFSSRPGEIEAATLPDPLGSGAMAAGAVLLMDDTAISDLSLSIVAFSVESLQARPEAVRRFLRAWSMAVDEMNSNPEAYDSLLVEVGRVPESIQGSFQMPEEPSW